MHSWWVETNSTLSSQPHQFLMEIHTDTILIYTGYRDEKWAKGPNDLAGRLLETAQVQDWAY